MKTECRIRSATQTQKPPSCLPTPCVLQPRLAAFPQTHPMWKSQERTAVRWKEVPPASRVAASMETYGEGSSESRPGELRAGSEREDRWTEQKLSPQRASLLHCLTQSQPWKLLPCLSPENLQRREEGGCKVQLSPHPCKTPGGLATWDALSDSCWVGKGSVPSGAGEDTPGQGWLLRPPPHNPSFPFSPSISPQAWGFGGVWLRLPYLCSRTTALPYPLLPLHHSYLLTSAEGAGERSGDTNSHSRVSK